MAVADMRRSARGSRKVLLPESWLDEFDAGAVELDVQLTKNEHGKGRVVRPKKSR